MSSSNLFGIGLSGLNSAQLGMSTTGNNISNAATPGYNVERALFAESNGMRTGNGFIGAGVTTVTIQRQFDSTLTNELFSTQSKSSSTSAYSQLISTLNNLIGSPTAGIGAGFTSFFNNMAQLSGAAGDGSTRQTVINSAQQLANQINGMGQQIDQIRQGLNTTLSSTVTQINNLTRQIAQLNAQIAGSGTAGQQPNQLLDARDQAVSQLTQLVGVNVQTASDGTDSITLSNGMTLVQGNQSYQLGTTPSPSNPAELALTYQEPDSANPGKFVTTVLPDSSISGGSLGGTLQYRSQTLDPAAQQLGALATSFAAQVNAQNALGIDQTGKAGGPLFQIAAPTVIPNLNNTGNASVAATLTNPASPPLGDLKLTFDGTNYTLTNTSTGTVVGTAPPPTPATNPIVIGGVSLTVNGTVNPGDSFVIQPTEGALDSFALTTADGSAIAAGSPSIASNGNKNTGSGNIQTAPASPGFIINTTTTITYDAATQTLSGFPPGSTVTFGNPPQTVTINAATDPVPYNPANGGTYTINSTATPPASPSGISFSLSGTPATGDTFTIAPNTGTTDGSNANFISNVKTSTVFNGTTLNNGYAEFVNNVGNATSNLQAMATTQSATLAQITAQQQSVSGVNLDEEATMLLQYQQMYQANSKVIQTAQSLFQSILSAIS